MLTNDYTMIKTMLIVTSIIPNIFELSVANRLAAAHRPPKKNIHLFFDLNQNLIKKNCTTRVHFKL